MAAASAPLAAGTEGGEFARAHAGHVVPLPVLLGTLAALLVLTAVTVGATWFDLGNLNLWIALGIATVKASLVILYFMHLRYDRPVNALVLIVALLFVATFIGITLMDTRAYEPELIPGYAPALGQAGR
jgi:cytochrome c oxidase subunit 4